MQSIILVTLQFSNARAAKQKQRTVGWNAGPGAFKSFEPLGFLRGSNLKIRGQAVQPHRKFVNIVGRSGLQPLNAIFADIFWWIGRDVALPQERFTLKILAL